MSCVIEFPSSIVVLKEDMALGANLQLLLTPLLSRSLRDASQYASLLRGAMLQYMGSRQPPRKYTVPEVEPTTCQICLTRVWTPRLFQSIRGAHAKNDRVIHTYDLTSQELRESAIDGCGFCRTIADGVHGKVFLDELYARFEKTESWPGSGKSDDEVTDVGDEASSDNPDIEEDDWRAASAFNEEEIGKDVTGGWDTWDDRDTLIEPCIFRASLSFERGEDGLFTFMNALIEAAHDDPSSLHKLSGEQAVELRYHINEQSTQVPRPPLFTPTATKSVLGSEMNMQKISHWMREIRHTAINPTSDQMPARLIDVGATEGLRIVATSTISQTDLSFAALSYVWGVNQSFVLLERNKSSLMSTFQIEQLPRTIRDAVTVTRGIGLRYLWVDALCIVQDSTDDKMRELPKMRLIYKCATVTIVASVANSAIEGFLHHTAELSYFVEPFEVSYSGDGDGSQSDDPLITLSYPGGYKRWKDPINHRAWTFQELILSTRAIIFSYRGVELLDRTDRPKADGMTSGRDVQLPNLPWNGRLFSLDQKPENIRQTWLSIRGEYSRRSLTYHTDKLLAVAAVAEEVGRSYQSRYLAGLWERDLALDLQWSCLPSENAVGKQEQGRSPRAIAYVAPSWSWASVNSSVNAFSFFAEEGGEEGGEGFKDSFGFQVVSCEVALVVPEFAYGAVKSGVLVVQGRFCILTWRPHKERAFSLGDTDGLLATKADGDNPLYTELVVGEATIDAVDPELMDGAQVTCLATRLIEHVPGRDEVEGLMLLAVDEIRYRRVGFFRLSSLAQVEDCEPAEITII